MSRHKTVLSFNELSSASCDLVDVIEAVDNSDCLNVVSNFVSSLYLIIQKVTTKDLRR